MIVRIWDITSNKILVSYPNLKDNVLTLEYEKQLCDYVWKDAVSSQLVIEGERECYWFELKKNITKH